MLTDPAIIKPYALVFMDPQIFETSQRFAPQIFETSQRFGWIAATSSFVSLDTESPRGLPEEPNCMKDTKFSTSGLHEWSARVIPNVNVQHEWSARYQMSMFSTSGLQILYCRGLFHDDLLLRCHNAGPSIPTASDSSIGVTMSLPLPSSCHKGRS